MVHFVVKAATAFTRTALFISICLSSACTNVPATATSVPILIEYSFASQPWLKPLTQCAKDRIIIPELRSADFQDLASADLVMRIGSPDHLSAPAYQIGTDDLLVITNPQNPLDRLSAEQVRAIFSGQLQNWKDINGNAALIQVWMFPYGEDIQLAFTQSLLGGSPVASNARLANTPDEMSQAVSKDVNAIGLISRRWKAGNTNSAFTAADNLPVLAIVKSEPQGELAQIIACLQK